MKATTEYWAEFAQKHQQELKELNSFEFEELKFLVMSAIDEEVYHPNAISFRMTWSISSVEPAQNLLNLLRHAGFRFVEGSTYNYFEWNRFLTREV